ncbi:hypothetical protein RIF29_19284 [Crotalaria pallida]|uniref:Uncharacterized protein n=1 Tax=Crotalaria pallida TaxID=3830 RepID=A0AAN9I7L4_CROPI
MESERFRKRPRFDLSQVTINLKLTPGKHTLEGAYSNTICGVENFVQSSNVRNNALFANDSDLHGRRFGKDFYLNDSAVLIFFLLVSIFLWSVWFSFEVACVKA